MKTYDETIRAVFGRMEAYEQEKRKKRAVYRKVAGWSCCLCLMALLSIGAWQGRAASGPEIPGPDKVDSAADDKIVICPMEVSGARLKQDIALMWDDFVESARPEWCRARARAASSSRRRAAPPGRRASAVAW